MTAQFCNFIDLACEQFATANVVPLVHQSYAATITFAAAAELIPGQATRWK